MSTYENGYVPQERYWADDVSDQFEAESKREPRSYILSRPEDYFDNRDDEQIAHFLTERDLMADAIMDWIEDYFGGDFNEFFWHLSRGDRDGIIESFEKRNDNFRYRCEFDDWATEHFGCTWEEMERRRYA